jgi:hypothetical protein
MTGVRKRKRIAIGIPITVMQSRMKTGSHSQEGDQPALVHGLGQTLHAAREEVEAQDAEADQDQDPDRPGEELPDAVAEAVSEPVELEGHPESRDLGDLSVDHREIRLLEVSPDAHHILVDMGILLDDQVPADTDHFPRDLGPGGDADVAADGDTVPGDLALDDHVAADRGHIAQDVLPGPDGDALPEPEIVRGGGDRLVVDPDLDRRVAVVVRDVDVQVHPAVTGIDAVRGLGQGRSGRGQPGQGQDRRGPSESRRLEARVIKGG